MSSLLARTCTSGRSRASPSLPIYCFLHPSISPSPHPSLHAPHPLLSLSATLPYYLLLLKALGLDEFVPEIRTAVLEGDAEHHSITIYEGCGRALSGSRTRCQQV